MKKYHVYAMGNALVDLEFQVSDETLVSLGVDKGVMTLIDEARHHELLKQLQSEHHLKACGGSAANTLQAINFFGGEGFYSCKVGDDADGDFYVDDMHKAGVDTNHLHYDRIKGTTGKCIALITPDADRTMNTYLGISEHYSKQEVHEEALENSEYAYIEGYLVAAPTAKEAAIHVHELANKTGTKTALTLSDPNMVKFFQAGLQEIIGDGVDLIFSNREEACLFCGSNDLQTAIEQLKRYAKNFVITLGPKGSLVYDGFTCTEIPPYDVDVVDTMGAGDMFAGAFLYGLSQGKNMIQAANLANVASAHMVAKFGPRLTPDEVQHTLQVAQDRESA